MKKFPILYKYTSKGQIQQWQIIVKDNTYWTVEGIKDGKLTVGKPTVVEGKNIGRANETSPAEQALSEAASKHQKKLDKNYNEILTSEKKFFEPMLAKDYKESKDINFKVRTFIQPKLDGLRCINGNNELASRNGKLYVACPHLHQNEVLLDGELYNHSLKADFNKIVSLCKKVKPTKEEIAEAAEKVEYWIYDYPEHDCPFSKRLESLKVWHALQDNKSFKIVPTIEVFTKTEIDNHHEKFLAEGYEGSIIRLDLGPYENKRSKQLLKYKDFIDTEYEIVDVIEGVGGRSGTVGAFTMKLPDGRTFNSNIKGEHEYLAELLKKKKSLIGKQATVKYFNLTPDGIPRFPFVIKIEKD